MCRSTSFVVMLLRCHSGLTFVYVISLWETCFHYTLFPLKSEPIDSMKWELDVFWFTCACKPVRLMTRNDDDMPTACTLFFVGTALFIIIFYYFYWITCTLFNLKDARDSRKSVQQCVVSPHTCRNSVLSNLLILDSIKVKYGECISLSV